MRYIVQNYKRAINNSYECELKDNLSIIQDNGIGAVNTFIKIMDNDTDDLMYFEDDVTLCKNFIIEMNKAFHKVGCDKIIQFFTLKKSLNDIELKRGSTYCQNQCFFIPAKLRKELVEYYNTIWHTSICFRDNPTAMDYLIRDFLKDNKYKYWIYIPNLVQHIIGKSVIDSRRSSKRQSIYYIGDF